MRDERKRVVYKIEMEEESEVDSPAIKKINSNLIWYGL